MDNPKRGVNKLSKICDKLQIIVVAVFALLYLFCTEVGEGNRSYLKMITIDFRVCEIISVN